MRERERERGEGGGGEGGRKREREEERERQGGGKGEGGKEIGEVWIHPKANLGLRRHNSNPNTWEAGPGGSGL